MRILILGGTKFLGRAAAESALASCHEVTLANRGATNPELFPEAERIQVDLRDDLSALAGRTWDAAIDLDPTQMPRLARRRAEALRDAVDQYVFVSTISVYAAVAEPMDESAQLIEPPDPEPEEFDIEQYGGLKTGSERAVLDVFGELGSPLQFVDARDLGAWLVHVAETRGTGIFNATGPTIALGETLESIRAAIGSEARLVWTDEQRVLDAGVEPWMELPLWLPGTESDEMMRVDCSRAVAAGLVFRALEETARDTLAWSREVDEQRPTLAREREREILAGA